MRLALALCALLVLSGCVSNGPRESASSASTPTKTADGEADPAPASDPARASMAPTTTTPAPNATANGTSVAPAQKPYSFTGSVPMGACAPAGPGTCIGASLPAKWWDAPDDKRIVRATLTLTWTSSSPATDALELILVRAESCGEGCWKGKDAVPRVVGKSPLVLDVDVPAFNEGEFPIVAVREASLAPDPIYGWAHPEQAFKVEGTLTVNP